MLINPLNEKRVTTRFTIDTGVTIQDSEQGSFTGKIKNLSAAGALIQTNRSLNPDSNCCLSINLQGDHSRLIIDKLNAKVIRCDGDTIGVEFVEKMEWLALFYTYMKKLHIDPV